MKLEIGMYVRTDYCIYKIFRKTGEMCSLTFYDVGVKNKISNEQIIKASHNIIDLIEVGDYVNGEKVIYKDEKSVSTKSDYKQGGYMMFVDEVKTIVTKERFNSMKFEVK